LRSPQEPGTRYRDAFRSGTYVTQGPASAPARRSAIPFTAASAVLPAMSKSYGHAQDIVNDDRSRSLLVKPAAP
jgi:hypothetical protein